MKDLRHIPLPRGGTGQVMWEHLVPYLETTLREILAKQDARNPQSDFADGIVATDAGGVTLGTLAKPTGRTVSVSTLFTYLGDEGRATDQRLIYPITTANRNSVQSIATVLTATSNATVSEIAIAAHAVKFDFGSVSYGAGTISGLASETVYYVYADDPNYAGGAVSYFATTNPDNLIAQGRYYVGFVNTPVTGSTFSVSAATSTNPIAITTATHGWVTGNEVEFAALPGAFAALNGNTYEITVTSPTAFTVAVDGSGFAAYTTGGTATRVTVAHQSGGGAGGGVGGSRWDFVEP